MEETKPWYRSNAVIASILQMAVGVAVAAGLINEVAGSTIIAEGPGVLIGAINAALGLWGLVGRIKATKAIT
jgi:hypothetical protein